MPFNQEFAYNLLFLTIYIIVVSLVFNRAVRSLDNLVTIETDSDSLKQQLIDKKINDLVDINFSFAEKYKLDEFKKITVSIKNKSHKASIDVDWKEALISDFENQVRPLLRVVPGTGKVSQDAIKIRPGKTLKEDLSDEKVDSPLFEPSKLKKASQKGDRFSILFLHLKVSQPGIGGGSHYLDIQFIVKKMPWQKAFTLALQPK